MFLQRILYILTSTRKGHIFQFLFLLRCESLAFMSDGGSSVTGFVSSSIDHPESEAKCLQRDNHVN